MRVAIVGSRDYPEPERVCAWIDRLAAKYPQATVVSGGARGVDRIAEQHAHKRGLHVKSFRVKDNRVWFVTRRPGESEGEPDELVIGVPTFRNFAAAAYWRNGEIVRFAQYVVAFHDGTSRGTADTIAKAKRAGKLRAVYLPSLTSNERIFMAEIAALVAQGVLIPVVAQREKRVYAGHAARFDEKRNTSQVFPVAPGALDEALEALATVKDEPRQETLFGRRV